MSSKSKKRSKNKDSDNVEDLGKVPEDMSLEELMEKNRLLDAMLEKQDRLKSIRTTSEHVEFKKSDDNNEFFKRILAMSEEEACAKLKMNTFSMCKASNSLKASSKLSKALEQDCLSFLPQEYEWSSGNSGRRFDIASTWDVMAMVLGLMDILASYGLACLGSWAFAKILNKGANSKYYEHEAAVLEFNSIKNQLKIALIKSNLAPSPGATLSDLDIKKIQDELRFEGFTLRTKHGGNSTTYNKSSSYKGWGQPYKQQFFTKTVGGKGEGQAKSAKADGS
jgi:hypothetical protein